MSTETERQIQALLAEHIGAWSAQTRDDLTAKLAAREAAARREALLEAEAEANALRSQIDSAECASRCYRRELRGAEAKVARVEVLAHRARLGTVSASEITAALAEPERDEEGGR